MENVNAIEAAKAERRSDAGLNRAAASAMRHAANMIEAAGMGTVTVTDLRWSADALTELVEGPYSQRVRLGYLLDALKFDERLNGSNPKRSTLDFPHAIQIVEAAIAALASVGGAK